MSKARKYYSHSKIEIEENQGVCRQCIHFESGWCKIDKCKFTPVEKDGQLIIVF